ncbi:MAG: ABC transporter substrate-binding protein [Dehalococcoidia bacterium]|nr:ABC transporter substrate-binding protein [Dehalococcoidia bacterium]
MKSFSLRRPWRSSMAAFLIPLLTFLLACGPGEETTPIPAATATPTAMAVVTATPTVARAATPSPTSQGPAATPTSTSVAVPTPTSTPGEQPKRGGTLLIVTAGYPESFDAKLLTNSLGYYEWNAKLYNNLVANYEDDKIECDVCTGWRVENSGKTWVFDLIRGVKFHDGRELTAEDVKYSLELQMGYVDGLVSPRGGLIKEFIETVDAPSKYAVRINLFRPTTIQNKLLGIGASVIYPKGTIRTDLQSKPQGSGPFLLTSAVSGSGYVMDRNPNYFKPGQPYLDRIEMTSVADLNSRNALFLVGKTKYYGDLRDSTVQGFMPTLEKMTADGKVSRKTVLGGCGPTGVWMNIAKPPFNDIKVRKVFNLATDRKSLDTVMMGAYGHASLMGFVAGMPYAVPEEKIWDIVPGWGTGAKKQQEIGQAKQLLIDAGFPNGLDILQFHTAISAGDVHIGHEPYQQMLKAVGVRTTLQLMSGPDQLERMNKGNYTFQVYILCQTTHDPDEGIGQQWITGGARNNVGYSNPEVDKLFLQMISESDFAKKKVIFDKIQDIIVLQDVAWAPTTQSNGANFWWKDLRGFTTGMNTWAAAGMWRADRYWLQP